MYPATNLIIILSDYSLSNYIIFYLLEYVNNFISQFSHSPLRKSWSKQRYKRPILIILVIFQKLSSLLMQEHSQKIMAEPVTQFCVQKNNWLNINICLTVSRLKWNNYAQQSPIFTVLLMHLSSLKKKEMIACFITNLLMVYMPKHVSQIIRR